MVKTSRIPLLILSILLLALALGYVLGSVFDADKDDTAAESNTEAAIIEPPLLLTDFTLTDQQGRLLSLSDLRGQALLLFFGYTHCPDVCPATLAQFKQVKASLGDEAENVRFVFISVDANRDTPDVIRDYLARFDPDFIGLTGDEQTLNALGEEYGLVFGRSSVNVGHEHAEDEEEHDHAEDIDSDNYFVEHTSPAFLIDPQGLLRRIFFYGTGSEVLTEGLREILAEAA